MREPTERRLSDDEMAGWLPLIRTAQLLPQSLDRTLRERAGINHAHYVILITLAQDGDRFVTLSELARGAGLSRSRLSHALDALARRGWIERTSCSSDKRTQSAVLTDEGRRVVRGAAPAHVAQIRGLLGRLDAEERESLAALLSKLLPGIEEAL
ncbi:MarR family transcriptional regulator [Microbacterium betulae]|uniref:MarR family transcriptional regulator n=1 Tax=Microbacterium betulae TaxID=2981139 RepID=A0AA97FG25_9MICO|nr:MarR family transcriptional regulator [Microbacterium sp. AB]WOF22243.1 MarR family transcriptional regulator [Microbacterium sp. AB]